jgi:hypothetical protein
MNEWKSQEDVIGLVEMILKYNYEYYCKVHNMDPTLMHPSEIMEEVRSHLNLTEQMAFNNLNNLQFELKNFDQKKSPIKGIC